MASTTYEKIKATCELPSPTGVALQILELTQDENTDADQLASVVESDPAISARLLKLVNSPLAGMSRQVVSVQRATALLGTRTISSLALSFSLVSNHQKGRCIGFDYELFWSESLGCAVAARHLANRLKTFAPDEAFTCGLLSQIGRLALATAYPDTYASILDTFAGAVAAASGGDRRRIGDVEREVLGIDHDLLAAEMMTDWHLPAIFCEAVRRQSASVESTEEEDSRTGLVARVLHLSGAIALVLTQPTIYRDTLSTMTCVANELGISPGVHQDMFNAIGQEWQEAGTILAVRTLRVPPLAELYSRAQERRISLQGEDLACEQTVCRENLHVRG